MCAHARPEYRHLAMAIDVCSPKGLPKCPVLAHHHDAGARPNTGADGQQLASGPPELLGQ